MKTRTRSRVLARFLPHVDTSGGKHACWPWTGHVDQRGYGRFRDEDGFETKASRFALTFALGRPIAEGMLALHICDNPPCVNPTHLYEGSSSDNLLDSYRRFRRSREKPVECKHGHPFTDANTAWYVSHGHRLRRCRQCRLEAGPRYEAARQMNVGAAHSPLPEG